MRLHRRVIFCQIREMIDVSSILIFQVANQRIGTRIKIQRGERRGQKRELCTICLVLYLFINGNHTTAIIPTHRLQSKSKLRFEFEPRRRYHHTFTSSNFSNFFLILYLFHLLYKQFCRLRIFYKIVLV